MQNNREKLRGAKEGLVVVGILDGVLVGISLGTFVGISAQRNRLILKIHLFLIIFFRLFFFYL